MNHKSSETQLCDPEFGYSSPRAATVAWSLFFAASAMVFGYDCVTNERALIINGIHLSPFAATVFYGFVAGVSMFCLGMGVWLLSRCRRIVFGKEWLVIPKSWWSSAEKIVPYRDLRGVRLNEKGSAINGARLLYVQHKRGTECLSAAMFSSDATFNEFQQLLMQKMKEQEVPCPLD